MNVAILGYGTVGSGVFDVLMENRDIIAKRVGFPLDVKYVLDLRDFPGKPVEKYLTHDFRQIMNDPDVDIRKAVFRALAKADCPILEMRTGGMSLEESFLKLTEGGNIG